MDKHIIEYELGRRLREVNFSLEYLRVVQTVSDRVLSTPHLVARIGVGENATPEDYNLMVAITSEFNVVFESTTDKDSTRLNTLAFQASKLPKD